VLPKGYRNGRYLGVMIVGIHVWNTGQSVYPAQILIVSSQLRDPDYYKQTMLHQADILNITIEAQLLHYGAGINNR